MNAALSQIEGRREDGIAGNEVVVISIDIGANDFIPLVVGDSPCLPNPLAEACQDAAASALTTFRSNFADIMRRLRTAAGPEVEIVGPGALQPSLRDGWPLRCGGRRGGRAVQPKRGYRRRAARRPGPAGRRLSPLPGPRPGAYPRCRAAAGRAPERQRSLLVGPGGCGSVGAASRSRRRPRRRALRRWPTLSSTPPAQSPTSTVPAPPSTGERGRRRHALATVRRAHRSWDCGGYGAAGAGATASLSSPTGRPAAVLALVVQNRHLDLVGQTAAGQRELGHRLSAGHAHLLEKALEEIQGCRGLGRLVVHGDDHPRL